ncbi:uveal autoantigen with coiled-coil domains and ankyrin repeats protein isoform X2 [Megalops cyprinoides]|uniref:uveal autoantigen with coiled-coil domains and ankyrin repeats protein isoform X2 n=1 Tax=Megalops cyprinoides TaxID=118141 RepID=UPI001864E16F|nr:uveal autoantigen with coiled-coil domains and ankyrin repeats protein isoform X2 [Megalops cyprinoides]
MSRWLKCTSMYFNTDWNKYDDRLMKAVERGEVDKVAAVLSKKGIVPTKLDVEGRSAFHLAATRGHLDCLNLILGHNVDVTATEATGKNALHLAARNGQSLCVQKLLQHNCPVGNVDLQGRTALHDAVMAGCSSSVKLLCDSGASVNASDFDGRTPLVLATQMCHPRICQLLLERGADIAVQDKQNKTALILGCEYACKDAVEVLLKSGADVTAVDGFGHDSYHYARLSKNPELVALVKSYLDAATKAKEAAKKELRKRQPSVDMNSESGASARDQIIHDLERQNESQQESLRTFHQEQRVLLDKVSLLQQQLSQEKLAVEDIQKEREQLKLLLSAKEKDEGARAAETVKVQMKSHMGEYSGQSVVKGKDPVLVKQSYSLDAAQMLQPSAPSRSMSRPLELSRQCSVSAEEVESLRRELEVARRRQNATEEEVSRLQGALSRKNQECEELAQSRDADKRESDRQVRELEEALGDVQKRMLDSEAKVKQLQAHVVAVKEHLNSQLVEDLRAELQDVKAKYEGASAEVGRVRNHLKQSEKALEEYRQSEGRLVQEEERLNQELARSRRERDEVAAALADREARAKDVEARLASTVPKEKFDNMKNLLTNAVDEKERQLAELREDYDRVLEEAAELHRELDGQETVALQEHERVMAALEEQNAILKKKLADVTSKSQALIREVQEGEEESKRLGEHMQELTRKIQTQYVPVKSHAEVKKSLEGTVEELSRKLEQAVQKSCKAEAELQRLQVERGTLKESVTHLQTQQVPREKLQQEVGALTSRNAELQEELEELQRRCRDKEKEAGELAAENGRMKRSVSEEFVAREEYEKVKVELSEALEGARAEMEQMRKEGTEREKELREVKEGNATLKEKLKSVQMALEKDYVSLKDHKAVKSKFSSTLAEAEERAREATSSCELAQEETKKLHGEIEEQKRELDTIQEAIQSRFVPVAVMVEKEDSFKAALKDLTEQLAEVQEKHSQAKMEAERHRQDKEKLKVEVASVQQRMETGFIPSEKHREVEDVYKGKMEELGRRLGQLQQQCQEVTAQKRQLEEQSARCNAEVQSLQHRLESEYVRREKFEAMQESLNGTIQQAREEREKAAEAYKREAERVGALEKELQSRGSGAALQAEHVRAKEALEKEVARLRVALKQEEENSAKKAEDVASLQTELLRATQAMEDARRREEEEVAELRAEKRRFEEEVEALGGRLSSLAAQCEELHAEAAKARENECRARTEMEALETKSSSIEREIRELKGRYDDSLSTIGDLQKRIQMSSEQTEVKDKKITELLTDVERLKQALNGLSQLAYAGSAPSKRQTQHIDTLQAQVKSLQQQLADAERQHREVVSIYRTHLLSAAQGHMDEDVQAALLQIIRMRQELVC